MNEPVNAGVFDRRINPRLEVGESFIESGEPADAQQVRAREDENTGDQRRPDELCYDDGQQTERVLSVRNEPERSELDRDQQQCGSRKNRQ